MRIHQGANKILRHDDNAEPGRYAKSTKHCTMHKPHPVKRYCSQKPKLESDSESLVVRISCMADVVVRIDDGGMSGGISLEDDRNRACAVAYEGWSCHPFDFARIKQWFSTKATV